MIPQPHLAAIVGVLVQAVTTILWTAAGVVFYFSARCGVENFDLHYLAEAIGQEPPAAAGAATSVAKANRKLNRQGPMLVAAAPVALPPPDAIRRAAEEVVARPYYQLGLGGSEGGEPFILQVLRWILKPFRWLFDSMEGLPDLLRWGIVILCAILCAAILTHIVYTLLMAIRGPELRRGVEYDSAVREIDPLDLEQRADVISRDGDYIGAIRLLFRAALRRIELAEKRKLRPGFTNRELLNRYRASPLQSPLARFVEMIELKWYGNLPCVQADHLACRDEHGLIRQFIDRREATLGT